MVSDRQLSKIIDQWKRPTDFIERNECPFCESLLAEVDSGLEIDKENLAIDPDKFRRHLGQHLHEAALFALDDSVLDSFWLRDGEDSFLSDDSEYMQDDSWSPTSEEQSNRAKDPGNLSDDLSTRHERKVKEAEASMETLGDEHTDTLGLMHTLAICYSEAGRRQEALQLTEQVVEANKRTLGDAHPDTLSSTHELAIINETPDSITEARRSFPNPEVKSQAQASNSQKRKPHSSLAKFWKIFT